MKFPKLSDVFLIKEQEEEEIDLFADEEEAPAEEEDEAEEDTDTDTETEEEVEEEVEEKPEPEEEKPPVVKIADDKNDPSDIAGRSAAKTIGTVLSNAIKQATVRIESSMHLDDVILEWSSLSAESLLLNEAEDVFDEEMFLKNTYPQQVAQLVVNKDALVDTDKIIIDTSIASLRNMLEAQGKSPAEIEIAVKEFEAALEEKIPKQTTDSHFLGPNQPIAVGATGDGGG